MIIVTGTDRRIGNKMKKLCDTCGTKDDMLQGHASCIYCQIDEIVRLINLKNSTSDDSDEDDEVIRQAEDDEVIRQAEQEPIRGEWGYDVSSFINPC